MGFFAIALIYKVHIFPIALIYLALILFSYTFYMTMMLNSYERKQKAKYFKKKKKIFFMTN